MHPAPQVLFDDVSAAGEPPELRGEDLATALGATLRARQFGCSPVRRRRGGGHSVTVSAGPKRFEIRLAPHGDLSLLLVVTPLGAPGLVARLLGRPAAPVAAELRALSLAVHHQLTVTPDVRNIRWMLGGPPEQAMQVETPRELPWRDGD